MSDNIIKVDDKAYADLIRSKLEDTKLQFECPNCHKSITVRVGVNTCEFCGHTFTLNISAKI